MSLKTRDRVKETTVTNGFGPYVLAGASSGLYQTFLKAGYETGDICRVTIEHRNRVQWVVAIGTYDAATNAVTLTEILSSSANGAAVNFGAGIKDVFVTLPASTLETVENFQVAISALETAMGAHTHAIEDIDGLEDALASVGNTHNHSIAQVTGLQAALDAKAGLNNPIFTGTPTAPTAAPGTNTTQIANTAFVADALASFTGGALLNSPALTGTPTAPTAAPGTNTTQIATTGFVVAAIAALIGAAPGALDTLDELAAALGDDANFASTVTTSLAGKGGLANDNTWTGQNTFAAGTITASKPFTISQTWNAAGVTFAAIDVAITETAANASSRFLRLTRGGTQMFGVTRSGVIESKALDGPWLLLIDGNLAGKGWGISNFMPSAGGGRGGPSFSGTVMTIGGFAIGTAQNGNFVVSDADTFMIRDAANTLGLRNGVNAQAFRIYNTFTDASNYERAFFRWATNVFEIGAEAAGTGTKRLLRIVGPSLASAESVGALEITQTWNTTGAPTAIKLNVTNTASNAASLLMDLQVGGTTQFKVAPNGTVTAGSIVINTGSSSISRPSGGIIFNNVVGIRNDSTTGLLCSTSSVLGFASDVTFWVGSSAARAGFFYDGLGEIGLRDGSQAQKFNVYNKHASASDYHRIQITSTRATLSNVSGASVTATGLIPDGAIVVGVTTKVTTALGTGNGTTGYQVGDGSDPDRWGAITGTAAGTSSDNRDWTATTVQAFTSAQDVGDRSRASPASETGGASAARESCRFGW
jgi:hypothetical protein